MDTVNVADKAFAGTVTEAGVVSAVELSLSATWTPPAAAGLDSVTVQDVLAFCPRLATPQLTEVTWVAPIRVRKVLAREPPKATVTAAVLPAEPPLPCTRDRADEWSRRPGRDRARDLPESSG